MCDHNGVKEIGIRELKAKASDLVRQVAENGATYTITRHGHAVGQLGPATLQQPANTQDDHAWQRLLDLMATLQTVKTGRRSALTELSKMRR